MRARPYQLTSVVFSHYVEKARWALDRFAVPYTEAKYMPLFHFLPVFAMHRGRQGKRDKASTPLSTPVLRTPGGRLICDSGEIVRYLSDRYAPAEHTLYPDRDMSAIEQRLHDRLGPHSRRVVYATCFRKPELIYDLARNNVGAAQAAAFRWSYAMFKPIMVRYLTIDAETAQRSIDITRRELDWVSSLLADGRPYLTGDRFTAADLSFACMASPCLVPPEYGVVLPDKLELPEDIQRLVEDCRATPAGQLGLRLFAQERRRVIAPRSHDQNRAA